MSSDMPEDWSRYTLGELCVVKARIGWRGLAATEYTDDGAFLVAGKHIQAGQIKWDECDHLSEQRYEESPEIMLQLGDVIFSKDGSIGNPALIERLPGKATINGTMMMLRARKELLDPNFLYQFVNGPAFAQMVTEKISGSSIPHIFQRDIVHMPFFLPSVDEQRRISEVLRSVDAAIAISRRTLATSRKIVANLAIEIAHKSTDTADLGELGAIITGRTPPPARHELWDGDLPFVTPGDLDANEISVSSAIRSLKLNARHNARTLPPRAVLVTCIGSTIGKTAIAKHACATNQQINAICCEPDISGYVYLACIAARDEIIARAGKQAVPIINKSTFAGVSVPIRDRDEMLKISKMVDELDSARSAARSTLSKLTALKSTIAADLLSGSVRVPA